MKKKLLKNIILACLFVVAGVTVSSLKAQTDQTLPLHSDENASVLRLLTNNKFVEVTVTPDAIEGDVHAISIGRGDVLTIRGKVSELEKKDISALSEEALNKGITDPDHYIFEHVALQLGKTKNIFRNPVSITTADKERCVKINADELGRDGSFEFHLTGDYRGEQRVSLKACWSVNGESRFTKKYPIVVTVR